MRAIKTELIDSIFRALSLHHYNIEYFVLSFDVLSMHPRVIAEYAQSIHNLSIRICDQTELIIKISRAQTTQDLRDIIESQEVIGIFSRDRALELLK